MIRRQGQGTFVADDVGRTSQAQAQEQAFEVLERAVRRARQLGLDRAELLEAVQLALDSEEDAS